MTDQDPEPIASTQMFRRFSSAELDQGAGAPRGRSWTGVYLGLGVVLAVVVVALVLFFLLR